MRARFFPSCLEIEGRSYHRHCSAFAVVAIHVLAIAAIMVITIVLYISVTSPHEFRKDKTLSKSCPAAVHSDYL